MINDITLDKIILIAFVVLLGKFISKMTPFVRNKIRAKMTSERDFDIKKMFMASKRAIEHFAKNHENEVFYAFSIDSNMLCLNSVEKFQESLKKYQEKYPEHYSQEDDINHLKYNTGDWEYQGFFNLDEGFNQALYSDHYNIPFEHTNLDMDELEKLFKNTSYHRAMSTLIKKLIASRVFDLLKTTKDFKAFLSNHEY